MNVYLMVDSEGISGIYTRAQTAFGESKFSEGRRFMTDDINACMRGLKEAGVDKIYVHDCHGTGYTALWSDISDDADYVICGNIGEGRFAAIEDCDAVILLGYHGMAGSLGAVLDHSYIGTKVQNMWLNGEKTGEARVDAAIAGDYGKPVIMVSGDDKVCAEVKSFLPNVVTAEVKKGLSREGAMLLPPNKAHELLRSKAKEAVANFENVKPYVVQKPVEIQIELVERIPLPRKDANDGLEHIDARTFKVSAPTVENALFKSMVI